MLLFLSLSVHGFAQASAADLTLSDATSSARQADVSLGRLGTEAAEWRAVSQDAPQLEFPGVETESDGDPVDSDAPPALQRQLGWAAIVVSQGEAPRGTPETYVARYATTPVLARAPPEVLRGWRGCPQTGKHCAR